MIDFTKLKRRDTPAKETIVVLFGSANDKEVKHAINRAAIVKRPVELQARPSFDTGLGKCGKHLCSCKTICTAQFSELEKKFG